MKSLDTSYTLDVITHQHDDITEVCFGTLCCISDNKLYIVNSVDDIIGTIIANKIRNVYIQDYSYVISYIYDYILRNNIKYNDSNKFFYDGLISYTSFTSEGGASYYLKLFIKSDVNFTCEIKSSKNKTMSSLSKLQTSFNVDIGYKLDGDDYTTQINSLDDLTDDLQNHCAARSIVLAQVIKNILLNGNTKLTIGSDAVRQWTKLDGDHFPDMPRIDDELDSKFRYAYRGGFTWLNDKYSGKLLNHGYVLDVNSLYPYVMKECPMPCGLPIHSYDAPSDDKLYIAHIIILHASIKNNGIPCISNMSKCSTTNSLICNEYLDEVDNMEGWFTNYDIMLIYQNYDVDIQPIEYYTFNKINGCFDNFIEHFYSIKQNSKGAKREIAKLTLDSLYGRFGIKLGRHKTKPKLVDGILKFEDDVLLDDKTIRYLPIAIFITSIARYLVINTALDIIDDVVYIDTDGIHIVGDTIPDVFDIGTGLGEWKVESEFIKAKYIGLKTYMHDEVDGSTVVKMAGAPTEVRNNINWTNFNNGTEVPGKILIKSLPGGYVRYKTKYKLSGCVS